jgi:hypothetical protein
MGHPRPEVGPPERLALDLEEVSRRDLARHPRNGWSLHGLEQCLRRRGAREEAERVAAQFREAWARADIELRASCFCATGR